MPQPAFDHSYGQPGRWAACLLAGLILSAGISISARAQSAGAGTVRLHTVNALHIPLANALETLIAQTNVNLVYESDLVAGKETYCQIEAAPIEQVLACLLRDTGLDYLRLSSGTYVLIADSKAAGDFGALTGQVVDANTGEPLSDAHVLLADASGGAVTNQAGRFAFNRLKPGRYPIAISYVGYRHTVDTLSVEAGGSTAIRIALEEEAIITAPIVVSDMNWRLPSESLQETERDAKAIADAPSAGGDVTRSLNTIIGIRVGDAMADVHVQGGEAGDHAYVLDGAPIFIPIPNGGVIGPFSPFALGRLTVRKAGYSVRYGSNLAGVIEAEHALGGGPAALTVQADPLSLNARWKGQWGDRNGLHASWMLAGRKSIWNVIHPASLESHFSQWSAPDLFLLDTLTPASLVETEEQGEHQNTFRLLPDSLTAGRSSEARIRDDFNFGDLHGAMRVAFTPSKSLYASFYRGSNTFGNVDAIAQSFAGEHARNTTPLQFESVYRWSNAMGQVRYESVIGKAAFASVGGWVSRFDLSQYFERNYGEYGGDDEEEDDAPAPGSGATWTHAATNDVNTIDEFGMRAEVNYSPVSSHFITAGIENRFSSSAFALELPGARGPNPISRGRALIQSDHQRSSLYAEDLIGLGLRTHLEVGIRLTHLGNEATVYAEPRAALRYDAAEGPLGPWAFRSAVGIFRQFVNQYDVAAIDVNAVLPYMRFWLPVDDGLRPPKAYHATAALLLMPAPTWQVRFESYYKNQPHQLVIDYAGLAQNTINTPYWSRQGEILTGARGFAYGAAVSIEKKTDHLVAAASYEYSVAKQQIANRFGGAWLPTSWNVPHRVTLSMDATPAPNWTTSIRWQASIGRLWAFREAYYNYLEPVAATQLFAPFDLSDPTAHRLPMYNRLDASLAYTRRVNDANVQVRLSLANLLAHTNVDEWSLAYDETAGTYRVVERPLAPFLPTITVRLGF
ncbi:MAG: carboxypeptidase-like regulatory domain-containing protein [Rhodothermales bacterium]